MNASITITNKNRQTPPNLATPQSDVWDLLRKETEWRSLLEMHRPCRVKLVSSCAGLSLVTNRLVSCATSDRHAQIRHVLASQSTVPKCADYRWSFVRKRSESRPSWITRDHLQGCLPQALTAFVRIRSSVVACIFKGAIPVASLGSSCIAEASWLCRWAGRGPQSALSAPRWACCVCAAWAII